MIGMVGLIEDVRRVVSPGFKNDGDVIALLGTTQDDLSMSEYAVSVVGVTTAITAAGKVPVLDLDRELAVQKRVSRLQQVYCFRRTMELMVGSR